MKHLLLLFFIAISTCANAQISKNAVPDKLPGMQSTGTLPFRQHNLMLSKARYPQKNTMERTTYGGPGYVFDTTRWNHLVDSTWGIGLADSAKMNLFNIFWKQVDSLYPCFINLPAYNWDSIANAIDTQIAHGVSKGRFAAMVNQFMTYINDGHSNFYDDTVNYPSMIYRGLPVFRDQSGLFGASVTTLNDTSALVYAAHSGHPFGLEPGDIILGYNGVPWTSLVQTILNNGLPNSVYKGSTDVATMHRYIQAAGENWYLFDTINIKKCNGTLVNLPTSLMNGVFYQDFCTEQMPVAGVSMPTYSQYYYSGISITSGVITGTRIGYVYMYDCEDATGLKLLNAVKPLVEDSLINGLIIDIRTNFGGGFDSYIPTFEYLNNGDVSWVGYGERYDSNRLNLYNDGLPAWYDITDTDANYFPHKVAILCGPNAVSAGDFLPVLFKHDPNVMLFGKSTAGAFGAYDAITVPYSGFTISRQQCDFFQVGAATSYLSHTQFPVDSNIWFDQDSVCAGIDNIVSTAVQWIEGGIASVNTLTREKISANIYPNPVNNYINISVTSSASETIDIRLCNMMGSVVQEMHYATGTGSYTVKMDIGDKLPSGNYYLILQDDNGYKTIKKVAVIH